MIEMLALIKYTDIYVCTLGYEKQRSDSPCLVLVTPSQTEYCGSGKGTEQVCENDQGVDTLCLNRKG